MISSENDRLKLARLRLGKQSAIPFAGHPLNLHVKSLMAPVGPSISEVAMDMQSEEREEMVRKLMKQQELEDRLALKTALMEAEVDSLMDDLSVSAMGKRLEHESRLAESCSTSVADDILKVLGTGTGRPPKTSARAPELGLVGFDSPGDAFREVYLQTESPSGGDRAGRAGIGAGIGTSLGGLGLAALTRGFKRGPTRREILGALGLTAAGAGVGAALPTRVTEAYDPDLLIELPESEERMAKSVFEALDPGSMPGNVSFDSSFGNLRGFHGGSPTFAYATDIDEMLREQPDARENILKGSSVGGIFSEGEKLSWARNIRIKTVESDPAGLSEALRSAKLSADEERTRTGPAYTDSGEPSGGGDVSMMLERLRKRREGVKEGERTTTVAPDKEAKKESACSTSPTVKRRGVKDTKARVQRIDRKVEARQPKESMSDKGAKKAFEGLRREADTFQGKADFLRGKKGVESPEGLVAWLEHKATGKWPGEHRR